MLRTPTEFELKHLMAGYDAAKAHQYYLRTRKLHPRQKGTRSEGVIGRGATSRRHETAKDKQRKDLQTRIRSLSTKLSQLEALIKKKEHAEASDNRKSKAKKERAAKEKDKPTTAAEKAQAARDAKKYRDKNQQKLETKTKEASNKSGGGSSKSKQSSSKTPSTSDLKALATKVRGQITVAKQKLAAL